MGKFYFIFSVAVLMNGVLFSQNYLSGKTTINFTDVTRSRVISTDIYYPALTAGTNVALASGTEKFPLVVFGHGFTISTSSYAKLGDSLAKYGYVVAFPSTETGFSPSHDNFGKDLSFLCTSIINLDTVAGSLFYQRLIHKAAVGGHSMGGGCSFLAATSQNPLIFALFNMSAAETNPSAITAAASVNIPTLIFSGSNDCIVPPSTQQSMYNNLTSSCKSVVNISGATHCQFADNNFNCTFGQISSGCNSSPITVTTVFTKLTSLLIPFLDYQLKSNCNRGVDYVTTLNSLSGITTQNTCAIPVCQILPLDDLTFYGNASGNKVMLNWKINNLGGIMAFVPERSNDGNNFENAGFINSSSQSSYSFIDDFSGKVKAFYRLKVMKVNNENAYSKTICIVRNISQFEISEIYPMPVKDEINVRINSPINTKLTLIVDDAAGKIILRQFQEITKGINVVKCPVRHLASGIYFFSMADDRKVIVKTIKLIVD